MPVGRYDWGIRLYTENEADGIRNQNLFVGSSARTPSSKDREGDPDSWKGAQNLSLQRSSHIPSVGWGAMGSRHCRYHSRALFLSAIQLRSEEHTSELQSRENLVCRLLLEKKKQHNNDVTARLRIIDSTT